MSESLRSLVGVFLTVLFFSLLLVSVKAQAAQTCAQIVEKTKRRTGDVQAPMPHMGVAAKYVAAAEEALRNGDEAKCLEEIAKTEMWLRMNPRTRGDR